MIVGITGTDGAGKGAVVDYLVKEKGFVHYSARALFIEEITASGGQTSRENMRLVANKMREEYGDDVVVTRSLARAKKEGDRNIVIESIRALAEAETLEKEGGILIAVDADQALRYARIQSRASETDAVTLEEFMRHEALEMNDPDPHGMQKAKVMESADYTVENNGTLEDLHVQIDALLSKLA